MTPILGGNPVDQGTVLELNNNLTFRAYKYSAEYEGLQGRDLSPKGWIETNPNETYCDELILDVSFEDMNTSISPNPAASMVTVNWDTGMMIDIKITDIAGKVIIQESGNGGTKYLDTSTLLPGMYFITIDDQFTERLIVK